MSSKENFSERTPSNPLEKRVVFAEKVIDINYQLFTKMQELYAQYVGEEISTKKARIEIEKVLTAIMVLTEEVSFSVVEIQEFEAVREPATHIGVQKMRARTLHTKLARGLHTMSAEDFF